EAGVSGVFVRKSRFNFGAEYQYSDAVRLGAYYLYGSEIGVNVQIQLNPKRPMTPNRTILAGPVAQRPSRAAQPEAWTDAWVANARAPVLLRDAMKPLLAAEGLELVALQVS